MDVVMKNGEVFVGGRVVAVHPSPGSKDRCHVRLENSEGFRNWSLVLPSGLMSGWLFKTSERSLVDQYENPRRWVFIRPEQVIDGSASHTARVVNGSFSDFGYSLLFVMSEKRSSFLGALHDRCFSPYSESDPSPPEVRPTILARRVGLRLRDAFANNGGVAKAAQFLEELPGHVESALKEATFASAKKRLDPKLSSLCTEIWEICQKATDDTGDGLVSRRRIEGMVAEYVTRLVRDDDSIVAPESDLCPATKDAYFFFGQELRKACEEELEASGKTAVDPVCDRIGVDPDVWKKWLGARLPPLEDKYLARLDRVLPQGYGSYWVDFGKACRNISSLETFAEWLKRYMRAISLSEKTLRSHLLDCDMSRSEIARVMGSNFSSVYERSLVFQFAKPMYVSPRFFG